ncbi:hypothetical protein CQY20_27200 [Mycolicibacterium agri]|uniref:Uncharacterized protein n=2 Tax=Mycolicibacterium agri TaxID=36811 RepID=A0A2A7MRJ7_MYCAG|nr:hypothetical protein CQY20_27200 [Mycolicibacterium agri]GFG50834.1 hypothetical protein MAGR_22750 [Mycolicibacterium agri]
MTRRLVAVSAFAVAAAAGPAFAASLASTPEPQISQAYPGQCLAWFGNQEDGKCLGYSNGSPIIAGTPDFGYLGPNNGGLGVTTGPLLPGQTFTGGIN